MKVTQKATQPVDPRKDAFLRQMNGFDRLGIERVARALEYIEASYTHEAVNPVSHSCFLPIDPEISKAKVALLLLLPDEW